MNIINYYTKNNKSLKLWHNNEVNALNKIFELDTTIKDKINSLTITYNIWWKIACLLEKINFELLKIWIDETWNNEPKAKEFYIKRGYNWKKSEVKIFHEINDNKYQLDLPFDNIDNLKSSYWWNNNWKVKIIKTSLTTDIIVS